ncbi:hypothetical protein CcI49_21905 [Frankia sp. CcI49]|uniref:DUF2255 family protein n=1 Tax=unclassified Frankia TaxID=2632575 RepID=UPI0006CA0B98|nr:MULTISPECIES: DUF2255 family protein [unclassified Frankia]KPM55958.1 hypothetical protein ACG83_12175 [Frankia sp. R43]ONH58172.1 hypothetical protein CcI49_21905 [Frankia sp. CcI49]
MSAWTSSELDALGAAEELTITTKRPDGTLRTPVPIWTVRVEDEVYVRSWRGRGGAWYRNTSAQGAAHIHAAGVDCDVTATGPDVSVRAAVDRAYRAKYSRFGDRYVLPMVADAAASSTLRLRPTD